MSIFESPETTHNALKNVGYLTTPENSTVVYLAANLNRPLLLEGPAGAGKTQLALSISMAERLRFIRLQCYSGITDKQAIGDYNRALQEMFVLLQAKNQTHTWDEIRQTISGRDFFSAGPLLEALESPERVVLLVDELDKVDYAFEALLLELLSVWEMSIPGMGTIRATQPPFTVITSNNERTLGFALRRRSFYMEIGHPSAVLEAEIVARKTPSLPPELHAFIAGLGEALRAYTLEKPPSISEMTDIAMALYQLGKTTILPEDTEMLLPLFGKTMKDRNKLMVKDNLKSIVAKARLNAEELIGISKDDAGEAAA
ncbi:AAA family ATPase [Edaphobacter modestus]|uniref:Dynein-related subfamily AAA family protein n=1 Tax=Edaphobacter modestus TaxID=388466 RepID=A0A4Q7XY57_9BACT|nr:MoxR family ATPase [Edaphobacter modestus]RZU29038.1 dynein-related subfamily AAA family protein [Edaphobacter modestus]